MTDLNARRVTRHERVKAAGIMKTNFDRAKDGGIPLESVWNIVSGSLGFTPTDVDFRQILFKAKYRSSEDGTILYGIKFGPKKAKPVDGKVSNNDGQSLTYEGGNLHLKLTGTDKSGKKVDVSMSPVKKVTIVIGSILLFFAVRMFGG